MAGPGLWKAFAAILPIKTVGAMGDARMLEQALALRAVTSVGGMTGPAGPGTRQTEIARISPEIRA